MNDSTMEKVVTAMRGGEDPISEIAIVEGDITNLGDAVADVFEQMLKGNWIDDHGHPVKNNDAMRKLEQALVQVMDRRRRIKA